MTSPVPLLNDLLPQGRMVGSSKSGYVGRHPDNFVVFNANLCTQTHGKVWYGDLDITLDEPLLQAMAQRLNETLYVLLETDARFENEDKPLLDKAVATVTPNGVCYRR